MSTTEKESEQKNGTAFQLMMGHVVLANPYTIRGRKSVHYLQEHLPIPEKETLPLPDRYAADFLNEIYVPPFAHRAGEEPDATEKQDFDFDPGEEELNIQEQAGFEDSLKSMISSHFVIRGVAGCGKTTYLHKLMNDLSGTIRLHLCTMEAPKVSIPFLGSSMDFTHHGFLDSNIVKFTSILFQTIHSLLAFDGKKQSMAEYHAYICSIAKA